MVGLRDLWRVSDRRIQTHFCLIAKRQLTGHGLQAEHAIVLGAEIAAYVPVYYRNLGSSSLPISSRLSSKRSY